MSSPRSPSGRSRRTRSSATSPPGEWEGRAGAYAIQGLGATLVERIDGDYLNVVGLPAALLVRLLAERFPGSLGRGSEDGDQRNAGRDGAAPARRRGPTGSFRIGAASSTAMTTLDSRTAATDAAEARRSAASVSP